MTESNEGGVRVERVVRRDLPFLGLLSSEKTEAIMRGERVQITAEESGMFRAQMNLIHDRQRARHQVALEKIREYARGTDLFLFSVANDALEDA